MTAITIPANIQADLDKLKVTLESEWAALEVQLKAAGTQLFPAAQQFLIANILPFMKAVDASDLTGAQKKAVVVKYLAEFFQNVIVPLEPLLIQLMPGALQIAGLSWLGPILEYVYSVWKNTSPVPAPAPTPAPA